MIRTEKQQGRTHCDDSIVKSFHNIRKWIKGSVNNTVTEKLKNQTINRKDNEIKKTKVRSQSKMMQRSRPFKTNEKKAIVV